MARLEDDLAATFRQGTHLSRLDPEASPESILFAGRCGVGGVCYVLSAMWVRRHISHRAEGPAGRVGYLGRESSMLGALAAHRQAVQAVRPALEPAGPACGYRTIALAGHGLAWESQPPGVIRRGGRGLEAETAALHAHLLATNRHHFLTFHGADPTQGHALAAYTAAGGPNGQPQLFLFDPNWGEFKVSARHAQDFVARLLAWYDGQREFGRITRLVVGRVALTD